AELVGHAAPLAAHAVGARLARIVAGQGLGRLADPDPPERFERIQHLLGAAADDGAAGREMFVHRLQSSSCPDHSTAGWGPVRSSPRSGTGLLPSRWPRRPHPRRVPMTRTSIL